MKVLDLFCGAGGASIGYARAGFDVVGVDIKPQKNYPYPFVHTDAMQYLDETGGEGFDIIHASPPCQGYSPHVSSASSKWAGTKGRDESRLIPVLRGMLQEIGLPYVIENVEGAASQMNNPIMLCGVMFGLPIARHRLFDSNMWMSAPEHPACNGVAKQYAEQRGWEYRDMSVTGKGRHAGTKDRWREIMAWPSIPVTQHELREAIPPAYTNWIGWQLQ